MILFLHFHRSGGTSIVAMLRRAGRTLHEPNTNGNPWAPGRARLIDFWSWSPERLAEWLSDLEARGVEVVACEWDFPGPHRLETAERLRLVTCLRDPMARMVSGYRAMGGDRRWGNIAEWYDRAELRWRRPRWTEESFPLTHNLSNHLVRMLNGRGTDPAFEVDETALAVAKRALERFESVLVLERPETFAQLERYGVGGRPLHSGRASEAARAVLPPGFRAEFVDRNIYDYALYRHALRLASLRRVA